MKRSEAPLVLLMLSLLALSFWVAVLPIQHAMLIARIFQITSCIGLLMAARIRLSRRSMRDACIVGAAFLLYPSAALVTGSGGEGVMADMGRQLYAALLLIVLVGVALT